MNFLWKYKNVKLSVLLSDREAGNYQYELDRFMDSFRITYWLMSQKPSILQLLDQLVSFCRCHMLNAGFPTWPDLTSVHILASVKLELLPWKRRWHGSSAWGTRPASCRSRKWFSFAGLQVFAASVLGEFSNISWTSVFTLATMWSRFTFYLFIANLHHT